MWTQAPAAGEMGQLRPDVRMQLEDDHLIGACGGHDPDSDSGSFHSTRSSTVSMAPAASAGPKGLQKIGDRFRTAVPPQADV